MSKYKIYRVDHYDPVLLGKRRRRMNIMFGIMSFIFIFIYLLVHQVFNVSFEVAYPVTIVVIGGFYYFFYRKLKAENKNFTTIGSIEFTRQNIIKQLGDSITEYPNNCIKAIELQKHIPALSASESKSGFYSYILTIDFVDSPKENLVVSDMPSGKYRDLSITETMKALSRIIPAEVIIR